MSAETLSLTTSQKEAIEYRGGNIMVNASAGAGKTTVLIARLINRIATEKISLDQLAAMTFTDDAALEMKNRLASELNAAIKAAKDPESVNFLKEQRAKLYTANISTIHTFCHRIVKRYYYLLNITRKTCDNVMDSAYRHTVLKELATEVIRDYLKKDFSEISALNKLLAGNIYLFEDLNTCLLNLFTKANNHIEPLGWLNSLIVEDELKNYAAFPQKLRHDYLAILKTLLRAVNDLNRKLYAIDSENTNLSKRIENIEELLTIDNYPEFYAAIPSSIGLVKASDPCLKADYESYNKSILGLYQQFADLLIPPHFAVENENKMLPYNKLLIELTKCLFKRFADYKKENEYIDFNDFEHYAYQILKKDDEAIAEVYRLKYREIMVDEFQDTNDIQYAIIKLITNANLFIVGDVKQSIYAFRNARPQIMTEIKRDPSFKIVDIRENFRSKVNIINMVNELFAKIMNIGQNAYSDSDCQIPGRESQKEKLNEIEFIYSHAKNNFAQNKARLTAAKIVKLHRDENLSYRDITVLVRRNSDKLPFRKVFAEYNIPCFTEDSNYFNSYVIEVLIAYIRLILDPGDYIALTAVLTSDLYEYSNDALAELQADWWHNLKDTSFIKDYHKLSELAFNNDLNAFISYLLKINNFYDEKLDEQEKANINLFITNLAKLKFSDFTAVLTYIEEVSSEEKESAKYINSEDDAVKVVTIHAAKGLQFHTVFLCSNSQFTNKTAALSLSDEYGLGFKFNNSEYHVKERTLKDIVNNYRQKLADCYENQRILYVALTRARERLYIVENFIPTAKENDPLRKYNFGENFYTVIAAKGYSSLLISALAKSKLLRFTKEEIEELPKNKAVKQAVKPLPKYQGKKTLIAAYSPSKAEKSRYCLDFSSSQGTDIGTKAHHVLEVIDYNHTDTASIRAIEDLPTKTIENIQALFANPLFKEAIKGNYKREYPFFYKKGESIIQGYIDFVSFFPDHIILIDYKSDVLDREEEFIERYSDQLKGYREALKAAYPLKIQTYIYSLRLQKMIEIH